MFLTSACWEILLNASKLVVLMKWISLRYYCVAKQVQAAKTTSPRNDRLFNGNVVESPPKLHLKIITFPNMRLNNQARRLAQLVAKVSGRMKLAQGQAVFALASRVPWIFEGTELRQVLI